jgi:thiol-disulfide isomerase/thioredoxin
MSIKTINNHKIKTLREFEDVLQYNDGLLIIKFAATWSGPCKTIENLFYKKLNHLPPNTTCVLVDIDESFEVYTFFKSEQIITGIPAILAYEAGNTHHKPNELVIGADLNQIEDFFHRYSF